MAEHMDMHLAEQIQGDHSTKRAYEPEDSPLNKRTRTYSADSSRSPPEPVKEEKRIGQTTLDGFIRYSTREASAPSSPPTQTRLSFLQDPPTSPSNMGVSGLIDKTRMLLETSLAQGVTQQAFLADPSVIFFQSDKTDRGWGCGYRNIQMVLSYVVGQTEPTATTSTTSATAVYNVPIIPDLQRQLEYAWTNGFDAQGAEQLGHKVKDTKKWIGTTEAWSVLSSLGIRCSILDFHMPSGPNGTHPAMFAAVYNYFCSPDWSPLSAPSSIQVDDLQHQNGNNCRIVQTAKPPLYMQHQGHSRTIVGIEILEDRGMNLLVFDPGRWLHNAIPTLRREAISQSFSPSSGSKAVVAADKKLDAQYLLKAFRLQVGSGVAKAQYQLLGISGLYNEDKDHATESGSWSGLGSRSSSSHRSPSLQLFSRYPTLSVGWTEEEHENSKSVTSTRVP
ncbi:MAG: peptidase family C78-domain-containing protein [Linnemannia gamsii]|nr:MAG: peptidase family C78-domain-containing protein [Linnemannia gamsii]